ncbi:MAG: hypothetical protein WCG50_17900 [Rhodoferax sp.]|uniref:hypothetical protein n=1 Tax=Rhodoferax sp. TaxID=50421 RepID=UPI00301AA088
MASTNETAAWEALKSLGDTALAHGGIQGVLQLFVSVLTSADQVARESDEAGHSEELISEAICTWITATYVPEMQLAFSDRPSTE